MMRRRVAAGHWHVVEPNVFSIGAAPASWARAVFATWLAWGPGAAVSHLTAGTWWEIAGFAPGLPVHVTVPRSRKRTAGGVVHRNRLSRADVTRSRGLLVTTPARTLIDAAQLIGFDRTEEALHDAVARGVVSVGAIARRVDALGVRGRPGIRVIRRLLSDLRSERRSESVFETRLLRELRGGGLPEPVRQHEIRRAGRFVARVDFAYPDARLAIEADSFRWHSGRAAWERDRARQNALTLLEWRVIHVTWRTLRDTPDEVLSAVRAGLADM